MKTASHVNTRTSLFLTAMLGIALVMLAPHSSAQGNAPDPSAQGGGVIMYLGKVEVRGQKKIIKTLQAIKVGLRQPYSTDPRLANVVVCRLQDEAGSHLKQWLTCGTNRNLTANREYLQTAMISTAQYSDANQGGDGGGATCTTSGCYINEFAVFNTALDNLPGHYLHTLVNGPGLRSLLQKIPYPAAQQKPASTTTAKHL